MPKNFFNQKVALYAVLGSCGECVVMLSQQCYCGRSQCEVACGESGEEGEEGKYECPLTCGRYVCKSYSYRKRREG